MTRSTLAVLILLVAAFAGTARLMFLAVCRWGVPIPRSWMRTDRPRATARHAAPKGRLP